MPPGSFAAATTHSRLFNVSLAVPNFGRSFMSNGWRSGQPRTIKTRCAHRMVRSLAEEMAALLRRTMARRIHATTLGATKWRD